MIIKLKKQAEKYLRKTDANTYQKLKKAIHGLESLQGDIIRLEGTDKYRLKIYHYRIIFTYDSEHDYIVIEKIGSRGDVYNG
ncbi:MAG: type II toxin-antitoxin system RelE/ParE family toxin [Oscillospiraceae bacterium]|jgi:mRNA-degrading endonuclease RelE of RelBE toxin-antitoxin system|nr:type II toxin-antitoxin system RelE/ParE family toxin [Oscillospiraceae bacterium]